MTTEGCVLVLVLLMAGAAILLFAAGIALGITWPVHLGTGIGISAGILAIVIGIHTRRTR